LNKQDFIDWKRHPVTQVVFSQLTQRITDLQEILSDRAGENPVQDREYVGAIKAYRDLLNTEYEEQEESK
jgi:hypothetical protein